MYGIQRNTNKINLKIIKYLLIFLLFLSLKTQAQTKRYFEVSEITAINFRNGSPEFGGNFDFHHNKLVLETNIIGQFNNTNPVFFQEKVGVNIKRWSFLGGYSYHVYSNNYIFPENQWKFVTEIKYTVYVDNISFGYSLQHDGDFVSFGVLIGTKL